MNAEPRGQNFSSSTEENVTGGYLKCDQMKVKTIKKPPEKKG